MPLIRIGPKGRAQCVKLCWDYSHSYPLWESSPKGWCGFSFRQSGDSALDEDQPSDVSEESWTRRPAHYSFTGSCQSPQDRSCKYIKQKERKPESTF